MAFKDLIDEILGILDRGMPLTVIFLFIIGSAICTLIMCYMYSDEFYHTLDVMWGMK